MVFLSIVLLETCQARTVLTAPISYYVATTGSDDNDCLSARAPCRHIQVAVNKVCNDIDQAGFAATVQLVGGSAESPSIFNERIRLCNYLGSSAEALSATPKINGDPNSPKSYVVDGTGGIALLGPVTAMPWTIDGISIRSAGGVAVEVDNTGLLYACNIDFGPAAVHVLAVINAVYVVCGNQSISGNSDVHWSASHGGIIITQPNRSLTIAPGVSVALWFIRAEMRGMVSIASNFKFNGGVLGHQYAAVTGATIQTGGIALPGSLAGINDGTAFVF